MLNKINRLSKIGKTKSSLFTSPLFNIRISANEEDKTRFAFVVSKRIDKRAVVRNRTKRVLRNIVQELLEKIQKGRDFIFISKKPLGPEQKEDARSQMEEVLKKADLLKK